MFQERSSQLNSLEGAEEGDPRIQWAQHMIHELLAMHLGEAQPSTSFGVCILFGFTESSCLERIIRLRTFDCLYSAYNSI